MLISTRIRTGRGNIRVIESGPNKAITVERLKRKVLRELHRIDREASNAAA